MLLGTVTTATTTGILVTLDGATTAVTAVVPDDLQGRLLAPGVEGSRVIGVRIGSKFYVTNILSGSGVVDVNFAGTGAFGALTESAIGSFTWPAGAITIIMSITGYVTVSGTAGVAIIYIDHSAVTNRSFFFNTANEHTAVGPVIYRMAITAGTHTFGVGFLGNTDLNDTMHAHIHWSPK